MPTHRKNLAIRLRGAKRDFCRCMEVKPRTASPACPSLDLMLVLLLSPSTSEHFKMEDVSGGAPSWDYSLRPAKTQMLQKPQRPCGPKRYGTCLRTVPIQCGLHLRRDGQRRSEFVPTRVLAVHCPCRHQRGAAAAAECRLSCSPTLHGCQKVGGKCACWGR